MIQASKLTQIASWLALSTVAAALLTTVCFSHQAVERPAASPMDRWSITELVVQLGTAGVPLRVLSTSEDVNTANNAFLTTTDQGWNELNHLPKVAEHIDRWHGTLFVEKISAGHDLATRTQFWGEYYVVAGPFLFFGDPELLARVHAALDRLAQKGVSPG